jgi:opacity protein-like surface antigen
VSVAAAMLTAVSSLALAQSSWFPQNQPRGFYVGGGLGAQYLEEANISGGAIQNALDFDIGPVGLVNFGYAFGNGFRTELELGARWNGVSKATGPGASGGSGDVYAYSAMANLLYDIATGTPWTPYLGAGAGWTWMDFDGTGTFNGGTTVDSDDNEFTLQLIAGVDYSLDDNWRIGLQYRYFFPLDPEDLTASNGQSIDSEYKAHNVLLTLRYTFWTPPRPAPAPAPGAAAGGPPPPPPPPPRARPPRAATSCSSTSTGRTSPPRRRA